MRDGLYVTTLDPINKCVACSEPSEPGAIDPAMQEWLADAATPAANMLLHLQAQHQARGTHVMTAVHYAHGC